MGDLTKRCWVEISLDNIAYNYRLLKAKSGCRICGIVKADAYGHGAVNVAKRLKAEGADFFAVATIDEAVELRDAGFLQDELLILGYTPPEYVSELAERNITQTVVSLEAAAEYNSKLKTKNYKLRCHLKIDTGMTRFGVEESGIADALSYSELEFSGAFTHLPVSDEPDVESVMYTKMQIERFRQIAEPYNFRTLHCANSGGVLLHRDSYLAPFNMVRPGIALYGHFAGADELRPGMTWKTRVCQIREIDAGTTVGYGRTWLAKRSTKVAVLSVGYADGLNRGLSNRGEVYINGALAPIIGRVCMDLTMIDVTDVPGVIVGSEAEIFGEHVSVAETAEKLGTITYELLCNVSKRVPRLYSRIG
ncbi:MAG: alanine racemase [Oscillospiraceae bacterium]|jgi:alanine racemase|nr:alanine racemase [Oscillospiraceae bacterium]